MFPIILSVSLRFLLLLFSLKLNYDASIKVVLLRIGAGMVIRDSNGNFMAASSKVFWGCFSPEIGKYMALREGLLLANQLGLKVDWVEADVVNIIADVISGDILFSHVGTIVNDIRALCRVGGLFHVRLFLDLGIVRHVH
ncbi:hypothetical protein QYF36_017661 [Acer negundo]|nr:hypothetical protein QYF36_017661 [Acer negundo]